MKPAFRTKASSISSTTTSIRQPAPCIRGVLKNRSGKLVPGLYARMKVPGSGRYRALLVPDAAVGNDQSQRNVLVVDKDNKVGIRPVKLVAPFGRLRSIVFGISAEDRIVTNGQMHARPVRPVTPTEVPNAVDEEGFSDPGPAVARLDAAVVSSGPESVVSRIELPAPSARHAAGAR